MLLDHVGPGRAGGVERTTDVHGQVPFEVVRIGVGQGRPSDDAGIVDHDVEASERPDRRSHERFRARDGRHVTAVGDGRPTRVDDLGGDAGGRAGVRSDTVHRATEVVDDDARAPFARAGARTRGRCHAPRR